MSGAGAGRWGSSPRYGMAAAASPGSRRHQARGDSWPREAPRDSPGCEVWGQKESEGQAPHSDAYIVIPPNPTRREWLQKVANKELEDLAKWKEQHRPGPIISTPQKLACVQKRKQHAHILISSNGGRASESEVRQKQQLEYIQSKYKQKLKKEEYERIKREAEDADLLKKKAIQREKADRLEEKRRQQEQQRKQMLKEDHYLKTTEFLNRLDLGPSKRTSYETEHFSLESTAMQVRSQAHRQMQRQEEDRKVQKEEEQRRKAELLTLKQRQEARTRVEAHQNAQWRINNAFLDRLQNNSQPGGIYQSGCLGNRHFNADSWDSS